MTIMVGITKPLKAGIDYNDSPYPYKQRPISQMDDEP